MEDNRTSNTQGATVVPTIAIAAFYESEDIGQMLRTAAADRRMRRARVEVFEGGIEAAIERFRTTSSPNLIIIETQAEESSLLTQLARLAEESVPNTRVLIIGRENDINLYRELLSHGVSEYVVAPIDVVELCSVVARIFSDMNGARLGTTVAFFAAVGGAGSSTIAHNTAWAMAATLDADVVLADTDMAFGTASLDFNLEAMHQGIVDAVLHADKLDEELLDRLLVKPHPRLCILPSPSNLDSAEMLTKGAFNQLLDMARERAGFTLFDLSHSWTVWLRELLRSVDQVVITARPDLASLRNTKTLLGFLKEARPNDPPAKLVLNQVKVPRRPEIKPSEFAEAVERDVDATFAFDPRLFGTAAANGQMIGQLAPTSQASRTFNQLATSLLTRREDPIKVQPKKGLASRLLGRRT